MSEIEGFRNDGLKIMEMLEITLKFMRIHAEIFQHSNKTELLTLTHEFHQKKVLNLKFP